MAKKTYARTQTPHNSAPLHGGGGDMMSPLKILGEFWEIDEEGKPSTAHFGVLEWNPSQNVKNVTLFNTDESDNKKMFDEDDSNLKPVCLHGIAIQNMEDGKPFTARYSIDAFRGGGTDTASHAAHYRHATKNYLINNIWQGNTSVNLYSTKYTQIGFSFKGIEKWLRHIPDIEVSGARKKIKSIDAFEMDILRDMHIPNVGKVRLLCGHKQYGDIFDQSLSISHQWQIDFSRPKTYNQCLDIIHAFWDSINIAIGCVVPLGHVILTRGKIDIPQPERFFVRISHTSAGNQTDQLEKILNRRQEYIPLPFIPDTFWKKWVKASLSDKQFSDYVTLLTTADRIERMPQQYELLTLLTAIDSIVKKMKPMKMKNSSKKDTWFPKDRLRCIVKQHPKIFPEDIEDILDRKVEDDEGLMDWAVDNRNKKIAHIEEPGAVHSYSFAAGIYTERILWLLAVSLLFFEYKLLQPYQIRRFFWNCHRSEEELGHTPDKSIYLSLFPGRE